MNYIPYMQGIDIELLADMNDEYQELIRTLNEEEGGEGFSPKESEEDLPF